MRSFEYQVQIKEHHLDTFGHVNNAVYLALYEEARWQFITDNGFGLEQVQQRQQGPVILEVNLRYKRELKNRELIRIVSTPQESKGKIMRIHQQMINQDNIVCSEATFVIGFMDFQLRKLIIPPAEWMHATGMDE